MSLPSGFTFSSATAENLREIYDLDLWSFPSPFSLEKYLEAPCPLDFDRTVLVRDEAGRLAGMHASYAFSHFEVPGATVPVSGLTWVGVHPQFRRRGILRAMINQHFADCVARNEAVSVLFAAEPTIYGRFGYGESAFDLRATFGRGAALRPQLGTSPDSAQTADSDDPSITVRVESFDRGAHEGIVENLHERAARNVLGTSLNRPGWARRESAALRNMMHHPIDLEGGREAQRIVIVERDGEPVGYAKLRRKVEWANQGPSGTVSTGEVIALDPGAAHKLWSVLLDFDLTTEVNAFMIPVDDPIVGMLENNRSIGMAHVDNVWTRIINVPAALSGRQYAADVDVVLEIIDDFLPSNAGRWRLRAPAFGGSSGGEVAEVLATTDDPDVTLNVRELGAAYLGGVTLASLAASGLVTPHSARALAQASTAFSWPIAPMTSWVF